jgi:hypothetical protein
MVCLKLGDEIHMHYWQIAAGSSGRDYTGSFLDLGMAFVGGKDQPCLALANCGN